MDDIGSIPVMGFLAKDILGKPAADELNVLAIVSLNGRGGVFLANHAGGKGAVAGWAAGFSELERESLSTGNVTLVEDNSGGFADTDQSHFLGDFEVVDVP